MFMNKIQIGDTIPTFILKDQNGNDFDISSLLGSKKLVIFFYPQDGSLNCTREACYFRDLIDVFELKICLLLKRSDNNKKHDFTSPADHSEKY